MLLQCTFKNSLCTKKRTNSPLAYVLATTAIQVEMNYALKNLITFKA